MAGILTTLATLPYAPVRIVTALSQVLMTEAEQELYGSAGVRRELEGLDDALAAGTISEADHERAQQEILDRLAAGPSAG
jgi:hypothetical protein